MHSQRIIDMRHMGWGSRGSIVFAGISHSETDGGPARIYARHISTPGATLVCVAHARYHGRISSLQCANTDIVILQLYRQDTLQWLEKTILNEFARLEIVFKFYRYVILHIAVEQCALCAAYGCFIVVKVQTTTLIHFYTNEYYSVLRYLHFPTLI